MTTESEKEILTARIEEGVQIRSQYHLSDESDEIAMMQTNVWPLPVSIVQELATHIQQSIHAFLIEKEIISEEYIQLNNPDSTKH